MAEKIRVPIASDADVVIARQRGRELAKELGFSKIDQTLIATAISEVARNIVQYSKSGEITLRANSQSPRVLIIVARDKGPGIRDVSQALQNGYSTSGGLGLGLPGARRLMDEFEVVSHIGKGTTVTMKKWLR